MGFVVLHIQKPKGNDAGTSAHIERTVMPANADPTRTHLNRELVDFPDGVETRTQAIQHRIETAGIKRKIRPDQVRALQIMLSASPEDMKRIQAEGKLNKWCDDNVKWLQDTFTSDNLVSIVLHMDEQTPHIHATVIPIVYGERRKAKKPTDTTGKKRYRKKDPNVARLCADDMMSRDNLKRYQDSYGEAMKKYGMKRGVKGSDARHISTTQHYRDLYVKNKDLKEDIEVLQEQKQYVNDKINDLYDRKDEARDKFLNMDNYVREKEKERADLEKRLQLLKQEYEPYKAQDELNAVHKYFPMMKEYLRIAELCEQVGIPTLSTQHLLAGRTVTANSFAFHSPEHSQKFEAKDIRLKIEPEHDTPNKLRLSLNGQNILDWFKEQFKKLSQTIRRPIIQPKQGRGRGI